MKYRSSRQVAEDGFTAAHPGAQRGWSSEFYPAPRSEKRGINCGYRDTFVLFRRLIYLGSDISGHSHDSSQRKSAVPFPPQPSGLNYSHLSKGDHR
jgi:hypothetical protein